MSRRRAPGQTRNRRKRWLDSRMGCPAEMRVCHFCNCELVRSTCPPYPKNAATVDHRTPRSRGGSDDPINFLLCCLGCNQHKGDLTEIEYRALIAGSGIVL